ncbi:hypothetical protein AWB64_02201 [Caballeronia sordidicola]|uniref:Lipoprotein n=1 Tax=Caballeronia sordidicola TaxID=196367 RepID=A0A158G4P6_CABSO|nr:hypothetical protein [Caballeronia sordidicola]SAL26609.1 hypothetical protein AWB64_02201 [Caballeronia sordidicola]
MKTPRLAAALALIATAAVTALALGGCVTQYDSLVKTVPVGSGTSHLTVLPFTACVKAKWAARPLKTGEYSPNADGDVITVHGPRGETLLLIDAEPSANGTGYTIYGDIVSAAVYVADAHTCD